MRKMKLDPDALQVETFVPRPGQRDAAGTVLARESFDTDEGCDPPTTRINERTCDVLSCGGTCWLTPNVCGSCGCGESAFDPCG